MRKLLCLALLVGSLVIAMPSSALGIPFTGSIKRADATPDWTHGHLTFTLNWNGPECFAGYRCIWSARATVQPALPSYPCVVGPWPSSDPKVRTVWDQDLDGQPPQTFNVDLPNAEILPGGQRQRLCLFGERGHWRDGCPLPCIIYPTRYLVDKRLLQGARPPNPLNTRITRHRIRQKRHKAKFRFKGRRGVPPYSFRCKLDRNRYRSCDSPKTYKHLDKGRHKFKVKARDDRGRTDSTPDTYKFRIRRK